jgi:hypothetical protein
VFAVGAGLAIASSLVVANTRDHGTPAARPLAAVGGEPREYRIVYRVTVGAEETTETLSVRRPFQSRLEVRGGRSPRGALRTVRVGRFGVIETTSPATDAVRLTVPPSLAPGDLRLLPAIATALAEGAVVARGTRRVSGRSCDAFTLGGPVSAGLLTPVGSNAGERAEICVDGRGLLLAESWTKDGTLLRERRAIEVSALAPRTSFRIPGAHRPAHGADGSITRVTDASRLPLGSYELPGPPLAGFTRLGRWTSISPRVGDRANPLDLDVGRQAALHELWVRGIDILDVEQGSLLGDGGPLPSHPHGRAADLGGLGTGDAINDLRLAEARANVPGFGYVRVAGTLPLADVIAVAQRLHLGPGGVLTPQHPDAVKEKQ